MDNVKPHELNMTLVTITLPAAQWAALRGAARYCAARDNRRAARRNRPLVGKDLNKHRAALLEEGADVIDTALKRDGN